jgi:hypothetical protein
VLSCVIGGMMLRMRGEAAVMVGRMIGEAARL